MLHRIEALAELSIARGCGFAAIGILTFMIGLYGDMMRATQFGGVLTLLTCCVLLGRGLAASSHPYKRTELWVMLTPAERPSADVAQRIIGGVLRETYLRYALRTATISVGLLTLSVVLALWGR